MTTGKKWHPKFYFGTSLLSGVALSAFYWVPAFYYKQFLAARNEEKINTTWVNDYFHWRNLLIPPGGIGFDIALLFLVIFSLAVLKNRSRISDAFLRKEISAWVMLSAIAFILLIPISAPIYALMGILSSIIFPWRMQIIFMLSLTYLIAVWMQWLISASRLKKWKGDYSIVIVFLLILGITNGYSDSKEALSGVRQLVEARAVIAEEYRTRWTDWDHWNSKWILSRYAVQPYLKKVGIVSGQGTVEIKNWGWGGIELQTQSD